MRVLIACLLLAGCAGSTKPEPAAGDYSPVAPEAECDDAVFAPRWYADADGDSYGDPGNSKTACTQPGGFVDDASDCDDDDATVSPEGVEVCDDADNDCNGTVDDAPGRWFADRDGDGWGDGAAAGFGCPGPDAAEVAGDCDDGDAAIRPDAVEDCDGVDDDCNGRIDDGATDVRQWFQDADGDGFGNPNQAVWACAAPTGYIADGTDCDDAHASAKPGGAEVCDGVDNDCNGSFDDGASDASSWYADADGDGYGDPNTVILSCAPAGVTNGDDCDDTSDQAHPNGPVEVCDGLDNDCDGDADSDALDRPWWYTDSDGDGYGVPGAGQRLCQGPSGTAPNQLDCDDSRADISPDQDELCGDGLDNDCSGDVDGSDGVDAVTWHPDTDGDGFGSTAIAVLTCAPPSGWTQDGQDCDDNHATALPGGTEICDGVDNDCDGTVDGATASDATLWYADVDGDGFGDPSQPLRACERPSDSAENDADCDDASALARPGGVEACDGLDNDCNGARDDNPWDARDWWPDRDGDGFGAGSPITACSPAGHVLNDADCNDAEAAERPGGTEICDGFDNDCDGTADGSDAVDAPWWYADQDGDSFGDPNTVDRSCTQPSDSVAVAGDCNDAEFDDKPGATEVCDGRDNDCDGRVDVDANNPSTWYLDVDGDGVGDSAISAQACDPPTNEYVAASGDCDDRQADTFPGNPEVCDALDNNCDSADDLLYGSQACPAFSCAQLLDAFPTLQGSDGAYWVRPGGAASVIPAFEAWCDMTYRGGGWTLVGKGRQGWAWNDAGRGVSADLLTPDDQAVAYLPANTVQALLGRPLNQSRDGVRIHRVEGFDQELLWDFPGRITFSWLFDTNADTIEHHVVGVVSVVASSRDTWSATPNNEYRVFTWDWASHDYQRGFGYGGSVCGGGWEFGTECHSLPFTRVWVRK